MCEDNSSADGIGIQMNYRLLGYATLLGALIPSLWLPAQGQDGSGASSNVQCIEELRIPTFGPLALLSPKDGTVVVHIPVLAGGLPGKNIQITGPDPRLEDEVRITMDSSKFRPDCRGKTVTVEFIFVRDGEPLSERPVSRISFLPPNTFRIQSRPVAGSIEVAPPRPR